MAQASIAVPLIAGVAIGLLLAASVMLVLHRRRRADQQALVDFNQRWQIASGSAGLGIIEWEFGQGQSVWLDECALRLHGYSSNESLTDSDRRFLRGLLTEHHTKDAADTPAQVPAECHRRYSVLLPSGGRRCLEIVGGYAHRHEGQCRIAGVVRDIGGDVAKEQIAAERAEAKAVEKGRLEVLARLSHELRTPLNAVIGFAELLKLEQHYLSAQHGRYLGHIADAGKLLLRLVDETMGLVLLQSHPRPIHVEPVDLKEALLLCLQMVESVRAPMNIVVETEWPREPVVVCTDRSLLVQIAINLLSNGCKYNRLNGRLRLGIQPCDAGAHITIADEGNGMSSRDLQLLFQPFLRLPQHSAVKGHGLGLAIVKSLAEKLESEVSVKSVEGAGTEFKLTLRSLRRGFASNGNELRSLA